MYGSKICKTWTNRITGKKMKNGKKKCLHSLPIANDRHYVFLSIHGDFSLHYDLAQHHPTQQNHHSPFATCESQSRLFPLLQTLQRKHRTLFIEKCHHSLRRLRFSWQVPDSSFILLR